MLDTVGAHDNFHSSSCNNIVFSSSQLWHHRLGHAAFDRINVLKSVIPKFSNKNYCFPCNTCHLAKQHRLSFVSNTSFASKPFDLLHIDIWGNFHQPSVDGYKYFLTVVDDASRFTWVFLLKQKSDVQQVFPDFCTMIATQFNVKIKCVRSDNAHEFQFTEFYKKHGIIFQKSCVDCSQ